jgi:hypothetical protein
MTKAKKAKASPSSPVADEVKKVLEEYVRDNPRLEFVDSASFADAEEAAPKEQDLADIYRRHLSPTDPN